MEQCKICHSETNKIFDKIVLKKYPADYHQCKNCNFVQTSEPIWLKEAYSNAITSLDIGLMNRNIRMLNAIPKIIDSCFPEAEVMLDYAGGYGVFTRLMRDQGYNFYRQDIYCENLFAKHFDIEDIKHNTFELVTAFEVFEHFEKPLSEIETLFKISPNIIFSTELLPEKTDDIANWWYVAEETGQHIAFFSFMALEFIAKKHGKYFYSKNNNLHLFTDKKLSKDQIDFAFNDIESRPYFFGLRKKALDFRVQRESLLEKDFQYIKSWLNK